MGEAAALRRALALGVAMAAVALASPLLSGSRASAGGGPGGVLAPADGALFGAAVQPPATGDPYQPVRDLEAKLGRKLAIDHYYRTWTTAFPDGREQWDASEGRIPMISWGKVATGEINAGKHDDLIRKRAQGLRAVMTQAVDPKTTPSGVWWAATAARRLSSASRFFASSSSPSSMRTGWRPATNP